MKTKSRFISMLIALTMLMTTFASMTSAFAEDVKWTEELTKDGWIKVTQEGGPVLGYSPNSGVTILTVDGLAFKDLNKNGTLDVYEDWRLDAKTRAEALASLMTAEEKLPLMFQNNYDNNYKPGQRTEVVFEQLDRGMTAIATPTSISGKISQYIWYVNDMQAHLESKTYGIPLEECAEVGISFASQWPNNLSLAATFDPEIVADRANTLSIEYRALGITGMMTPQVDLATEPRWSRIKDTFGEDPQLTIDMAVAFLNAMQSTYDEDGNDLGWGNQSLNSQAKHFPGDGPGESGRESHNFSGAYAVYPGDALYTHLLVFRALMNLPGLTGQASGIMPSYSIAIDEDGEPYDDEQRASGFSYFKLTELLREELGFEGYISSDFLITEEVPGVKKGVRTPRNWGVEDLTPAERRLVAIEAGLDRFGGEFTMDTWTEAYYLGVEKHGQEWMDNRINESVVRLLKARFEVGLFELPYVDTEYAESVVNTDEKNEAGYDALVKSVVMLKNTDNLIHAADGSGKPTVYIPMTYASGAWSIDADTQTLSKYFKIVSDKVADTLTGDPDKNGNPTASVNDIIRASDEDIAACDYALVFIASPNNGGNSGGYDSATGEYIPISLQYGEYVADSFSVRQQSLGGRVQEIVVESPYGAQTVYETENRSYYGNKAKISNANHLDTVLFAAEKAAKTIVVVKASNPVVFGEFEDKVDAILMQFGNSGANITEALCEIITGKVEPSGLLPLQMPLDMETVEAQYEDVPRDMECYVDANGNTYDFTFGLDWDGVINDERVEKYNVPALEG